MCYARRFPYATYKPFPYKCRTNDKYTQIHRPLFNDFTFNRVVRAQKHTSIDAEIRNVINTIKNAQCAHSSLNTHIESYSLSLYVSSNFNEIDFYALIFIFMTFLSALFIFSVVARRFPSKHVRNHCSLQLYIWCSNWVYFQLFCWLRSFFHSLLNGFGDKLRAIWVVCTFLYSEKLQQQEQPLEISTH